MITASRDLGQVDERVASEKIPQDKSLYVERTKPLNPSKLGIFLGCHLRYLYETERPATLVVGENPSALIGTATHSAAVLIRSRLPISQTESLWIFEQCIGRLLAHADQPRQLIGWMLRKFGKNSLIPRAKFMSQVGFAWALAQRHPPLRTSDAFAVPLQTVKIPVGLERRLASAKLDMAGRADEIYWMSVGHIRIVDFKTGSIREGDGCPKRNHVLQLAAYGLAVREIDPNVAITLELRGNSDRWIGTLDEPTANDARQLLAELKRVLPRGEAISVAGLSCIGAHCGQCAYRPSCPSYREHLERESMIDHGYNGFDISGSLITLTEENDFHAIRLLLAKGFPVRISSIPAILLPKVAHTLGAKVACFGIRSLGSSRLGALSQNFSVVDIQQPRNSAFQSCFHFF
jgi:hypothetical protein